MSTNHNANLKKLLRIFYRQGTAFASDLSAQLNVSVVTINNLLKQLLTTGAITEVGIIQRDMGRPAKQYQFNYQQQALLLITLQEKNSVLTISRVVSDMAGNIIADHGDIAFSDYAPNTLITAIAEAIAASPQLTAIGLAFPGKIATGVVTSSWNERFDGWNLKAMLSAITDLPVFMQNDVHMMTVGYSIHHQLPKDTLKVGIYFPRQSMPGITIYNSGTIIEGNHNLAGEAKYTPTLQIHGRPKNDDETATRLVELMVNYNIALAPHYFILASNAIDYQLFADKIAHDDMLKRHPNSFQVAYMQDITADMQRGLRWLIYRNTPFAL